MNDVDPHLPAWLNELELAELRLLKACSSQCQAVTEFGVHDCTSTWALLAGRPRRLVSYDIGSTSHPYPGAPGAVESEVGRVEQAAGGYGVEFRFVLGNTLEVEIDETDMVFFDTAHSYGHLKAELARHAGKARRFLAFHDTTTFADKDEGGGTPGIWAAIKEFMAAHPEWGVSERLTSYNGLTVLERS